MANWVEGNIVDRKQWTDQLCSLYIEAPISRFEAGQFTTLALDIDGTRIAHPYSFVNAPADPVLEFYFNVVPDGHLTPVLASHQQGETVWVSERPAGFFTLPEVPEGKHLWLLSSGTALGVFLSILRTETPWQRFDKITLVHAVRYPAELTYRDVLNGFKQKHDEKFSMISFVSREDLPGALSGRIPQAITDGRLEQADGDQFSTNDSQVMICGNPDMVRDTTEALLARGLTRNRRRSPGQITVEHY